MPDKPSAADDVSTLKIARGLSLPVDVAGEAIAILAKRGAGKTNTGRVLAEELVSANVQTVILDPVGAWWGLRSSADGKGAGLGLPILGGAHGDVPLQSTAGALIADVVVDASQSVLLDLSDFSKSDQRRFVTDFAERLYQRKARAPQLLHLILEEADEFAPQRVSAGDARMVGAIEALVRRGRGRGIGLTMITQRSASLNKSVLEQADLLILMRTTGPRDRAAVEAWVSKQDVDGADEVLPSLSQLETGEAWVWNPERGVLSRTRIRLARTFDSSRTPKAGERRVEPQKSAPIDLAKLGEQIQATAERAKENDPTALRKRVRDLERQLAQRPTDTQTVEVEKVIEIPALREADISDLRVQVDRFFGLRDEILTVLHDVAGAASALLEQAQTASAPTRPSAVKPQRTATASAAPRRLAPVAVSRSSDEDVQLKAGAVRILETFARHYPMRMTKAQLGTLAKFKISGGTFGTYWGILKRAGYIDEGGGECWITDAGLERVGHVAQEPMTTEELLEMWRGALKAGARKMLDELVSVWPEPMTKEDLADRTEMTMTGGTFGTYLGTLRRNGLIEVEGSEVKASDTLFIGAAA